MSTETTRETTTVEQVDIDLDNILGTPGADSIMLPEDKKPSMFSKGNVDTAFLDKPGESDDSTSTEKPGAFEDVLKDINPDDASLGSETDEDEPKKTPGRAKISKDGTVELVKKLIDTGKIVPFDDDKPIEDYSLNDFEELL
jgi:hypothetical protein